MKLSTNLLNTAVLLISGLFALNTSAASHHLTVAHTNVTPTIDGQSLESQWKKSPWLAMNHVLIGGNITPEDFSGRYKLLWDEKALYALVEITDDVLFDQEKDPLISYWNDDCLEVFIDEDASGGDHLYNHNAFAYHIALDGNIVDIEGKNEKGDAQARLFNNHIQSVMKPVKSRENTYQWELAISLFSEEYSDKYNDELNKQQANKNSGDASHELIAKQFQKSLHQHKKIGFMLAYCDNDGSKEREHFIGSTNITPLNGDRNLGYKDASVFQKLTLGK